MPRRIVQHLDVSLGVAGAAAVGVFAVFGDPSARELSSLLGVLACSGLLARCIPTWVQLTSLERALACLLGITLILAAIGTYNLDRVNAPPSGVVHFVIVHRILVIAVCAAWPWLIGNTGTTTQRLARYRRQPR